MITMKDRENKFPYKSIADSNPHFLIGLVRGSINCYKLKLITAEVACHDIERDIEAFEQDMGGAK